MSQKPTRSNTWWTQSATNPGYVIATGDAAFSSGGKITVAQHPSGSATGGYDTTGTAKMYVNGSATALETISLVISMFDPADYSWTFTNAYTGYTTVRITVSMTITGYNSEGTGGSVTLSTDTTFAVKTLTSLTGSLITTTSANPLLYFASGFASSSNLIHIKHRGTGTMYLVNATVDDDSSTAMQLSVNGGLTLFQSAGGGATFYIGSYFGGTVTTNTDSGGTTATSPIVLANITSGTKSVGLPNPATFASSYLCICAYTTGTSTTNGLYIITNGYAAETTSSSYRWSTASGPSIGLFLVSDGSKWNIVGIYRGGNTSFDTTVGPYTGLTSVMGLSSANTIDSVTPNITPQADSGVLQLWKTKAITYTNGAVVGGSGSALVINSNYRRFYRNDNVDYSGYLFVTAKVGSGGTPTTFPIANYPSDN